MCDICHTRSYSPSATTAAYTPNHFTCGLKK